MKKVKIFLALGEGLDNESLELSDLVEHLNLILEPQDIHIYLTKWDYLTDFSDNLREEEYADTLEDCEICMVVFGKDFGSYTEKELRSAYESVCKEGVNPSKLYVYFKNIEDLTEDLKRFRDSFPEAYGHFTGKFTDVNTLKNDFLLQFQLFQSQNLQNTCPVEVKGSKVTVFGKDLFIDLMKIPFLGNNETYTDLLDDINDLREWIEEHEPDHKKYAEKAEKLREKEEKRDKMEKSIWNTAIEIARLSNQKCSERLKKAIELFNEGDNKGASAILDTEDILKDAEHNLQMKRLYEEGLKTNIEELKLKIKTIENEMAEGWGEEVLKLHEKIMEYAKEVYGDKSEEYLKTILVAWPYYEIFGQYDKALDLIQNGLDISKSRYGESHKLTADFYNDLGVINDCLMNFDESLKFFHKALNIRKAAEIRNNNEIIESYNNIANSLEAKSLFDKALEYQLKAYELVQKFPDIQDKIKAYVCLNLGYKFSNKGLYEKALSVLEESLSCHLKLHGNNHFKVGEVYKVIGGTYRYFGEINKAIENLEKALIIFERSLGLFNYHTAYCLNQLGMAYEKDGKYKEALENHLKSIEILKSVFGETNKVLESNYNNIGIVYKEIGEYNKALEYYRKALFIQIEIFGEESDAVAKSYENIADVYQHLGNSKEAEDYFIKALDIFEKIYGREHHEIGNLLFNLSVLYNSLGKYDKARENALKALNITTNTLGKNHPETGLCMSNYGLILKNIKDYDNAIHYLENGLKILKITRESNHPDIAYAINNLALFYESQKNIPKAEEFFLMAIKLTKKIYGLSHTYTIQNLKNLGDLYVNTGNLENALLIANEMVKAAKSDQRDDSQSLGIAYDFQGYVYGEKEEYQLALECHFKSLSIFEKTNDLKNKRICLDNIGWVYGCLSDWEKSVKYKKEAIEIEESEVGIDSLYLPETYFYVGAQFRKLGNLKRALEYRKKTLGWHLRNSPELSEETATSYNNVGAQYRDLGEYDKALEYIGKAYEISRTTDRTEFIAIHANRLGRVYALMGEKETAKEKFEEAISLLPEDHPEAIDSKERLNSLESKI